MLTRMGVGLASCLLLLGNLHGQNPAPPTGPPSAARLAEEFPAMLQQNVVAGKTRVGTQVQAKLSVATLFNGKVIPRNALLSGEVVVSVAKSATEPSRLAIRMDSAAWKSESVVLKVFLTSWYYVPVSNDGPDLGSVSEGPRKPGWNGMGQYPDPNSPAYRPFPTGDSNPSSVPDTPASATSTHRLQMKNVESEVGADGAITLTSHHSNIKLNKFTTYVLGTGEPHPAPAPK